MAGAPLHGRLLRLAAAVLPAPPVPARRPGRPRLVYLLGHAWGTGGTIRTVFVMAEELSREYDVHIVSAVRNLDETGLPSPRRVRFHAADDAREGQGRSRLARTLSRRPSVLLGEDPKLGTQASRWTDLQLARHLRRLAPDVVVGTRPSLTRAAVALCPAGVTLVGQEHLNLGRRTREVEEGMLADYARLDCLVTLTEADRDAYRGVLPGLRVESVPNAVTPLRRTRAARRRPVVLAVGRLAPQKAFGRLIDAFALIADRHPDWRLVICGDGPQYEALRRHIRRRRLRGRVKLRGTVEQIEREYARASLLAMSSRFEGMPMTLLEAMDVGLPVVSMDCPTGPRTLIDSERNGLLTPPDDVPALAAGMERLMGDPDLRDRLAAAARETAAAYSPAGVGNHWRALLAELGHPPGGPVAAPRADRRPSNAPAA